MIQILKIIFNEKFKVQPVFLQSLNLNNLLFYFYKSSEIFPMKLTSSMPEEEFLVSGK